MARSGILWCWWVWVPSVLAQEVTRVQTPAGTVHEVAHVPGGYFPMGTTEGRADEQPVHAVYLDDFNIDRFEVNNAQFAAFLDDVGRNADGEGHRLLDGFDADAQIRRSDQGYAAVSGTEKRPVAEVSWYGARAYCRWANMQFPTEAMWEKAARGTDSRTYPWGDEIDRARANYGKVGCCLGDDSDGFLIRLRWVHTWAEFHLMGSTIWGAMSGSGWSTGMARTTMRRVPSATRRGRMRGSAGCSGAVR
jgi:formylglycine-generating enzyme required for sulfatase activity